MRPRRPFPTAKAATAQAGDRRTDEARESMVINVIALRLDTDRTGQHDLRPMQAPRFTAICRNRGRLLACRCPASLRPLGQGV